MIIYITCAAAPKPDAHLWQHIRSVRPATLWAETWVDDLDLTVQGDLHVRSRGGGHETVQVDLVE